MFPKNRVLNDKCNADDSDMRRGRRKYYFVRCSFCVTQTHPLVSYIIFPIVKSILHLIYILELVYNRGLLIW